MKFNTGKCVFVFIVSFIVTLLALISIPKLQDPATCLEAALMITGAYAWFAGVVWVNVVLPMAKK